MLPQQKGRSMMMEDKGGMALPDGPGPREPSPSVSALRASVPNALDWASAFGPILKEAFPTESPFQRHAVAVALGEAVMIRKSWLAEERSA